MVQDNQPPLIIQVLIGWSVGYGKEILLGISMHSNMVNVWHFEELYLPNHLLYQTFDIPDSELRGLLPLQSTVALWPEASLLECELWPV